MKKKALTLLTLVAMTMSVAACGAKNRYGKDANFSDPSIYDSAEAEKEIATWVMNENKKISIDMDRIEFETDGLKTTFPACASDVVEGLDYVNFGDRIFASGQETWDRLVTATTDYCTINISVDNNSGKELYRGEMACYQLDIGPNKRGWEDFHISLLGLEIDKNTQESDVIAVLGEPQEYDQGQRTHLKYYFNKGALNFYFKDEQFQSIYFTAPSWDKHY